jgi:hypothetical protein
LLGSNKPANPRPATDAPQPEAQKPDDGNQAT